MKRNKVLITGPPGIGKTTIIRKTVDDLTFPAAGFYTQEIRESGRRVGFEIVDLQGRHKIMAHVDFNKHYRVSKYGVDLSAVNKLGTQSILYGIEKGLLIVIDEIGPMEILSTKFQNAVMEAIRSSNPVLGTIARHRIGFLDKVKSFENILLMEVNKKNRDEIPGMILNIFDTFPFNQLKMNYR